MNERIGELMESFRVPADEPAGFLCECDRPECQATVDLTPAEYAHVRSQPRHFAVLREHVNHEVERTVHETDRFVVIEKEGEAGALAEDAAEGASDAGRSPPEPPARRAGSRRGG